MKRTLVGVLLLIALFPGQGVCQSARLGIGGGFGTVLGDDFDIFEAGPTASGSILFLLPSGIQLGLSFDYSQFGVGDIVLDGHVFESQDEHVRQIDILGVVRYGFPGNRVQLFLEGKAGLSRRSIEDAALDSSSSGLAVGPMVGVLFPIRNIDFELGLDAMYVSYGNSEVEGIEIPDTDGAGLRILGRAGLSIPLGE